MNNPCNMYIEKEWDRCGSTISWRDSILEEQIIGERKKRKRERERDIFDRNFSRMKIFCAKFNTGGKRKKRIFPQKKEEGERGNF